MERWVGKIAVVTGASAGIGAATVKDLAKAGLIVIGLARRVERVEALKQEVPEFAKNIHAYQCDVSDEHAITSAFEWIEKKFGGVHILVNNAGLTKHTTLLDPNNGPSLTEIVNTNILGLLFCTREAFKSMNKRDEDFGYIININRYVCDMCSAMMNDLYLIFNFSYKVLLVIMLSPLQLVFNQDSIFILEVNTL